MNAEVVKAPLVLPERLCAVEVGQGDFFEQHPPWKRNSSALQPDGSLLVSTAGSIFVSANAGAAPARFLYKRNPQAAARRRKWPAKPKLGERRMVAVPSAALGTAGV